MAPPRSLRSRKQQTRLEFQPLSSSPSFAKEEYSEAVQSRLANVRFDGSVRNKRYGTHSGRNDQSLPTPQPTSPTEARAPVQGSSSPLSSLRTSPVLPPRFRDIAQKDFSDDDDIITPVSKRMRISDRSEDNIMGNTTSATVPGKSGGLTDPRSTRSTSTSEHGSFSTPARRSTRLATKPSPPQYDSPSRSQRVVSVDIASPTRQISDIGSAETSEIEDDILATKPANKRKGRRVQEFKEDEFIVQDDQIEYICSEDDVVQKYTPRKRGKLDNFIADNDEIEYITSADGITQVIQPSDPNRKSRKHMSPKKARRKSRLEQEELDEDLRDLQDSGLEDSAKPFRTRGGPVTTQRDKEKEHFNLLKKRRAGKKVRRVIDSDEDEGGQPDDNDDDDDGADIDNIGRDSHRIEVISDDPSSIEEEVYIGQQYLDDADDNDFVVEDQATTGRLGRPNNDIPLQFTSFASAKPRELFPHIIEWMVKNKISPAFDRNDDVYNISFSRLDDQVKAQAGSRLISSAWNSTFKWAILARPDVRVEALPGLDEDLIRTCDACNKSNHPARYDFTFTGKAYFDETLEPVDESDAEDENDSEDDDTGNDRISRDEQGHALASRNMHFYLGRFCAANAEMGHKLTHWKYHLNEQVLSYLEEQGVLSADAIVRRDKLNKRKREKEAESIVDMMQETGMIAELWQSFQDDLEDARVGMEGHERRGGRSKARIGSVRVRKDNGTIGEWTEGGRYRQIATGLESDSEGE